MIKSLVTWRRFHPDRWFWFWIFINPRRLSVGHNVDRQYSRRRCSGYIEQYRGPRPRERAADDRHEFHDQTVKMACRARRKRLPRKFHMLEGRLSLQEISVAKKTNKKIVRREYTKDDVKVLRAHSKAKTPMAKLVKITKHTEGSLRQKALKLGIRLGHRR